MVLKESKRIEATEFVRPVATRMRIPLELLQKKSHIFFYDSITLAFEESPKGQSEVSVKIRVMEDFFLILLRCFIVTPQAVSMRDVRHLPPPSHIQAQVLCHVLTHSTYSGSLIVLP